MERPRAGGGAAYLIGGGDGFEGHACVPEAVAPLLERLAPGLVTVMLDQLHQVRVSVCVCVRERGDWWAHTGGG
jgi:molybdopterin biosynthesis enzyme MoaB